MKILWLAIICLIVLSVIVLVQRTSTTPGVLEDNVMRAPSTKAPPTLEPNSIDSNVSPQPQIAVDNQSEVKEINSDLEQETDLRQSKEATTTPTKDAQDNLALEAVTPVDTELETDTAAQENVMPLDEEGRVILNERYSIVGAGSTDDPYQLHWPLLMSAAANYKPKEEDETIPAWLAFLDGTEVEISGFIFLPIIESNTSDVLLMFNQWDGCCVGVPPTSYDSVEVVLEQPINLSQSSARYATARGRLLVDPYIKKGWLIGLYILEDGVLLLPDL